MQRPPCASIEWMQTPSPKPWNSGIAASILSPGRNIGFVATICWESALKFLFVSTMPFVVPVVPPEYRMTAGSSDLRSTLYL